MLGAAVGNDGDVREGHLGELPNFAVMIRADFEDEIILRGVGGEDGEGDADIVVVALGRHCSAKADAEGGVNKMLGAGFSVAAGDGNHFGPHLLANVAGELSERLARVGDLDENQVRERLFGRVFDEGSDGAPGGGMREEEVSIVLVATDRDEERGRLHLSRVGADAVDHQRFVRDDRQGFSAHCLPDLPDG